MPHDNEGTLTCIPSGCAGNPVSKWISFPQTSFVDLSCKVYFAEAILAHLYTNTWESNQVTAWKTPHTHVVWYGAFGSKNEVSFITIPNSVTFLVLFFRLAELYILNYEAFLCHLHRLSCSLSMRGRDATVIWLELCHDRACCCFPGKPGWNVLPKSHQMANYRLISSPSSFGWIKKNLFLIMRTGLGKSLC
jgi:hypothetical protein